MSRQLTRYSLHSAARKNPCRALIPDELKLKATELGDIKFLVDGEEIAAHRSVLAALSPKYKVQFYDSMPETGTIDVTDVSAAAFREFLQFFYEDSVELTLDHMEDVINLAKQSMVDAIVAECVDFMIHAIGINKLLWCNKLATIYELTPLNEYCTELIGKHIKTLFQLEEFLQCDRSVLCEILQIDSLDCAEMDVFEACIAWAQEKCERRGIGAGNITDFRAMLGEALYKIRFCSMNIKEFAAITINYAGLLTAAEMIEVFQAIGLRNTGLKSSTFGVENSQPRNAHVEIVSKRPRFECSFSIGSCAKIDIATVSDGIEFACSKPIDLHGFVICNRIIHLFDISVYVKNLRQYLTYSISIPNTETIVTFDEPIRVNENEWCYILLTSHSSKVLNRSLYGFYAAPNITQNGIYFRFSEKNRAKLNLITRLLFDAVDQS